MAHVKLRHLLILITLLSPVGLTFAQERHIDQAEARALVSQGVIKPLPQLLELEPFRGIGRLLEIELEDEQGIYLYELSILDDHGVVHVYKINAQDGTLIEELSGN